MEQRPLGRTGADVSVVGLGTWQLGGDWGDVDEQTAGDVLDAALDAGVTLLDTADVYGDGRSEERIRKALAARGERPFVATKAGRRADPFTAEQYTPENLRSWIDRSRRNLGVDTLDLVQLHCPPSATIDDDATYDALDGLVADGVIAAYGVSVETCAQALSAIGRPGVASVQIILNAFRLKPLDEVLPAAAAAGVGIIARVPLASGLLSGRYTTETEFAENDHRNFNRHGQSFDVGETFSGVDYETGLRAVEELRRLVPEGATMAQFALRWILMFDAVTCAIPGAKRPSQAEDNVRAADLAPLTEETMRAVRELYEQRIRPLVHHYW